MLVKLCSRKPRHYVHDQQLIFKHFMLFLPIWTKDILLSYDLEGELWEILTRPAVRLICTYKLHKCFLILKDYLTFTAESLLAEEQSFIPQTIFCKAESTDWRKNWRQISGYLLFPEWNIKLTIKAGSLQSTLDSLIRTVMRYLKLFEALYIFILRDFPFYWDTLRTNGSWTNQQRREA